MLLFGTETELTGLIFRTLVIATGLAEGPEYDFSLTGTGATEILEVVIATGAEWNIVPEGAEAIVWVNEGVGTEAAAVIVSATDTSITGSITEDDPDEERIVSHSTLIFSSDNVKLLSSDIVVKTSSDNISCCTDSCKQDVRINQQFFSTIL